MAKEVGTQPAVEFYTGLGEPLMGLYKQGQVLSAGLRLALLLDQAAGSALGFDLVGHLMVLGQAGANRIV